MPAKTIAILGGAFDPVHRDHLRMACDALRAGACDEVRLVPSPARWDKAPTVSAEHRLAMLRIALAGAPTQVQVSETELHAGEFRGSLVMLQRLAALEPACEFRLLVGADSVPGIVSWRDPKTWNGSNPNGEQLLREFSLLVYPRQGYSLPTVQSFASAGYREPFCLDNIGTSAVLPGEHASRDLRARLWTDPWARLSLPDGVWDYVEQNQLYKL